MEALIEESAERFWALAGRPGPFPRALEANVPFALPLAVVRLPRLGLLSAEHYLHSLHAGPCRDAQRAHAKRELRLHACLCVYRDNGFVLLDGCDPADEQRFSLAHEVAHYLLDHEHERQRVQRQLGPRGLAVLDGDRAGTPEERLDAVLAGLLPDLRMDLLERTADGGMPAGVTVAERRADRLALELLAPEAIVLQLLGMQGLRAEKAEQLEQNTARVCQLFGLPRAPSEYYVKLLAREHGSLPSVRSWLGLS